MRPTKDQRRKQDLLDLCEAYIATQQISCAEAVHQTDRVSESALELIEGICEIVGYHQDTDSTHA